MGDAVLLPIGVAATLLSSEYNIPASKQCTTMIYSNYKNHSFFVSFITHTDHTILTAASV